MRTNPDEVAFPADSRDSRTFAGLSKREYFAAMALCGLCAATHVGDNTAQDHADRAVEYADALISNLNRTKRG